MNDDRLKTIWEGFTHQPLGLGEMEALRWVRDEAMGKRLKAVNMDAIDNRNMEILCQVWAAAGEGAGRGGNPRKWDERLRGVVLAAMRQAGDDALTDQVEVRLVRAFGSTKDVRADARLVIE